MKKDKFKVVFRCWKGLIIALFPEEPGTLNPETCESYMFEGGMAAAYAQGIFYESRKAKKEEYQSLLEYLNNLLEEHEEFIVLKRFVDNYYYSIRKEAIRKFKVY